MAALTAGGEDPHALVTELAVVAATAGAAILEIYQHDFAVDRKLDGSPLTTADRRSHEVIVRALTKLTPDVPILSEESAAIPYAQRRRWQRFWLVDPLDGTKEFVKRNGEFTVNIALIEAGEPRLGVVHTPARELTHFGIVGQGAFRRRGDASAERIGVRAQPGDRPVIVASRSHRGPHLDAFLAQVEAHFGAYEIATMGSSLKLCLVAEGAADVYPRLGPTSEWDTAAAHAVLAAAGGTVIDCRGQVLRYNKENILNPWFIACARDGIDWTAFAPSSQ